MEYRALFGAVIIFFAFNLSGCSCDDNSKPLNQSSSQDIAKA